MAVTKATLRTSSWDLIYGYLQTTNPISTNNIFSAMNSTLVKNKGYPIVILGVPAGSFERLTLDAVTESEVVMRIEVYDDNAQDCKALADNVTAKLIAGADTFSTNGLNNMEIGAGDYDSWEEGRKKIHVISFEVTFMYAS